MRGRKLRSGVYWPGALKQEGMKQVAEVSRPGTHCFLVYLFQLLYMIGQLRAHHQENLLYISDSGIFHSVWVAVWSAGWDGKLK